MKKFSILTLILAIGFTTGFIVRASKGSITLTSERTSTHYCSCIQDQPEFQARIFDATNEVNRLIEARTKSFASERGISQHGLKAIFSTDSNGNQKLFFYCSSRSKKINELNEAFIAMVDTCLEPHRKILDEAHHKFHQVEESSQ